MLPKEIIVALANYLILIPLIVSAVFGFRLSRVQLPRFVLIVLLAGLLALVLAHIASLIYYDPRPFVKLHAVPLVPHGVDNGFPSDHMLFASVVASVVFIRSRKVGAILWFVAILIGSGRVLALVHSPIDILASTLIAIVSVGLASLASHHLTLRFSKKAIEQ